MKCLITGATGFIGGYLAELLVQEKHDVIGLGRARNPTIDAIDDRYFTFVHADLLDRREISEAIRSMRPDLIFHMAAQSQPSVSWSRPSETFEANVLGTIGLFDEIRSQTLDPTVVVLGSSAEYATSQNGRPISEQDELIPSSPYGVSKLAQDHLARLYHQAYRLKIIRCRPFFLIGPRKAGDVSSDLARGVVAIEKGQQKTLPVGRLDVVRDLMDVRDGVEALWLLAKRGQPGNVYNICTGIGHTPRDILSIYQGLSKVKIQERSDQNLLRPIDEMVKIGDPEKIRSLGWTPRRPIHRTLEDILVYWREQMDSDMRTQAGRKLNAS